MFILGIYYGNIRYSISHEIWKLICCDFWCYETIVYQVHKNLCPKYFIDASLLLELAYSICALVNLINYRYTFMFRRTLHEEINMVPYYSLALWMIQMNRPHLQVNTDDIKWANSCLYTSIDKPNNISLRNERHRTLKFNVHPKSYVGDSRLVSSCLNFVSVNVNHIPHMTF